MRVPEGLGFNALACDCRWTMELNLRKGVVFSSAGIVGLPSGLFQKLELPFAALEENAIFAVQKLVSLIDFP